MYIGKEELFPSSR